MPWRAGMPAADPDARARWLYRALNGVWVFLGFAAVLATVQFYADPASVATSSIGRSLSGPLDDLWNVFWAIGGLLIAAGVWILRPVVEIVGHLFFTVAVLTNAVAVAVLLGPGPSFWLSLSVAVASAGRVVYLWVLTPHR
jgi:hypothetical protein